MAPGEKFLRRFRIFCIRSLSLCASEYLVGKEAYRKRSGPLSDVYRSPGPTNGQKEPHRTRTNEETVAKACRHRSRGVSNRSSSLTTLFNPPLLPSGTRSEKDTWTRRVLNGWVYRWLGVAMNGWMDVPLSVCLVVGSAPMILGSLSAGRRLFSWEHWRSFGLLLGLWVCSLRVWNGVTNEIVERYCMENLLGGGKESCYLKGADEKWVFFAFLMVYNYRILIHLWQRECHNASSINVYLDNFSALRRAYFYWNSQFFF